MDDIGYYGLDSPYWAYNAPGWKPSCVRCHKRTVARKYNSTELGSFAGEWICANCVTENDFLTPCEKVFEKK